MSESDIHRLMRSYSYNDTYDQYIDEEDAREILRKRIRSWYPKWHERANCLGMPTEDFFGVSDEEGRGTITLVQLRKAKRICNACDVFSTCLMTALKTREKFGVWGGTSGRTRARIWGMIDRGEVTLDKVVADYSVGITDPYENSWGMDIVDDD